MKRTVATIFYVGRQAVHTNLSLDANQAASTAHRYLAIQKYGTGRQCANVAQVIDTTTGLVLSETKRNVTGAVRTTYTDDPRKHERKIVLAYWE